MLCFKTERVVLWESTTPRRPIQKIAAVELNARLGRCNLHHSPRSRIPHHGGRHHSIGFATINHVAVIVSDGVTARLLDPLTQDACVFYEDHALFDDFTGMVVDTSEGARKHDKGIIMYLYADVATSFLQKQSVRT